LLVEQRFECLKDIVRENFITNKGFIKDENGKPKREIMDPTEVDGDIRIP
jgi:hypothetical protein